MSYTTDDPKNPKVGRGIDTESVSMQEVYLVLSEEERKRGFVRPFRDTYYHNGPGLDFQQPIDVTKQSIASGAVTQICGGITTMGTSIAETYARQPSFYGATYCVKCMRHRPLDEFLWVVSDQITDEKVGS